MLVWSYYLRVWVDTIDESSYTWNSRVPALLLNLFHNLRIYAQRLVNIRITVFIA